MSGAAPVPEDAESGQRDIVAFLADPASYDGNLGEVKTLSTHISRVFLAGERAYKLKRAVKYPYLDFSTLDLRRVACEAELELNRRTAPQLYLGLRGVGRDAEGRVGWAEGDDVADWVVVMRRFDQDLLFDALAKRGELTPAIVLDLVAHIAAFHGEAEPRRDRGGAAALAAIETENDAGLRTAGAFAPECVAALHDAWRAAFERVAPLLDARRAASRVRHCHGDLHLRNICLVDGKPVLFDCLEFSEQMATIDVLYDLAFLLMDLAHRGLGALANLALNRYLDLTGDDDGLAAVPLFLALRAAIRAKVVATADLSAGEEARSYLHLALDMLAPRPARLVALGGLSGTGKSTIAQRLAPVLGTAPGARVLRSDVIRKRLLGVAPETPLPEDAYGREMSDRVYAAIRAQAAIALAAGYSVVVDAVSLTEDERLAFAATAAAAGVPFGGLWLEAPADVLAARIAARRGDASDATVAVLERQIRLDPGRIAWPRIQVAGDRDANFAAVASVLRLGTA